MSFSASFCVAGTGYPLQCLYDDVKVCRQAESPPNTFCTINPDAVLSYVGGARYCVVSAYLVAECLYIDRAQCNNMAQKNSAVCIDRETMRDNLNPYRFDNRIQG